MEEVVKMSQKELFRHHIFEKLVAKELTQQKVAQLLSITDRQVRNILKSYKSKGVHALISKKRGKPSNRQKEHSLKKGILALIRERYEDFGPTLAAEKLEEIHSIKISNETLRQWMIEAHLWTPNIKSRKRHLSRQRRECFGELIQGDGSKHHWFGEDFPKANATVFVDDATSALTSLYFSESETLNAYFQALKMHLKDYGRPLALYTDHYAVFEANNKTGITQMQRTLESLDIKLILANSPQAKGRVERANRTLQDRLIKEMRLRGITSIGEANAFAPEFIAIYNKKFSKKPMSEVNTHRSLEGYDLERILCRHERRTLLSGCIFQYNNSFYKVQELKEIRRMEGRKVEIIKDANEKMRVFLGDIELKIESLSNAQSQIEDLGRKDIVDWKPKDTYVPNDQHPWKKYGYQMIRENELRKEMKKYQEAML
jgi:transposase